MKSFKTFKPRKEFVEKTKNVYLAAFREKFGDAYKPHSVPVFVYAFRGLATVTAVMFFLIGSSTYAYEKNVGPTSALYPLKRIQEGVRLRLTPNEQKPSFHLSLAEKRLNEAEALKIKNSAPQKAAALINDARLEVKKSFAALDSQIAAVSKEDEPEETPSTPLENTKTELQTQISEKIIKPTPASVPIRVISPNGGEKFKQGEPIKISWETANLSSKDRPYVHLYLQPYINIGNDENPLNEIDPNINCSRSLPYPISSFVWDGKTVCANGKSYTVNLPPTNNYKIQARLYVRPDNNPGKQIALDESDAGFSIISPTSDQKIKKPTVSPSEKDKPIKEENIEQEPKKETIITPITPKSTLSSQKPVMEAKPICKFVNGLISDETNSIKKEILNDKEIIERFNANCGGGFGGGMPTLPQPTN